MNRDFRRSKSSNVCRRSHDRNLDESDLSCDEGPANKARDITKYRRFDKQPACSTTTATIFPQLVPKSKPNASVSREISRTQTPNIPRPSSKMKSSSTKIADRAELPENIRTTTPRTVRDTDMHRRTTEELGLSSKDKSRPSSVIETVDYSSSFESDRNTDDEIGTSGSLKFIKKPYQIHCKTKVPKGKYSASFKSKNDTDDDADTIRTEKLVDPSHEKKRTTDDPSGGKISIEAATLKQNYKIDLGSDATINDLVNHLWEILDLTKEQIQKDTHRLVLFNQRMHIFQSNYDTRISEFIALCDVKPHFYVYAIFDKYADHMYTYDKETKFCLQFNDRWWKPVIFSDCSQKQRPLSILLSTFFAIRRLFQKAPQDLVALGQALEGQFFLIIREYMFAPAVLALKHLINEGTVFWFEKPLILDSLIQMLKELCPENIDQTELCDFVPLLFAWILNKCHLNEANSDRYKVINISDIKNYDKLLIDPGILHKDRKHYHVLIECSGVKEEVIRHVDVRLLTQYMMNAHGYYGISMMKRLDYQIYDALELNILVAKRQNIQRLNDEDIKKHYKFMSERYPSLTLITRSAIRSNVTDQLVLLSDCTAAFIYKNRKRTKSNGTLDVDAKIFESFSPLEENVVVPRIIGEDKIYEIVESAANDTKLPPYLRQNIRQQPIDYTLALQCTKYEIKQITVILLDISRSMFETPASKNDDEKKSLMDMSIIMLGVLVDKFVSSRIDQVFGLVHFGTNIHPVCSISSNPGAFEGALSKHPDQEEWTNMFDAINCGISMCLDFERENRERMASNYQKLIICISDGIENHSKMKFPELKKRLMDNKITLDIISFLRDENIKPKDKSTLDKVQQLCEDTHGYHYQNLPLSQIKLGATFEVEAAAYILSRNPKHYGKVKESKRKMPKELLMRAKGEIGDKMPQALGTTSRFHQILRQLRQVQTEMRQVKVFICEENICYWKFTMDGPHGTPYEGGLWLLSAEFHEEYPYRPPNIRFETEIYHVNITTDGKICHQIFDHGWSSHIQMVEVIEAIELLLKEPNFDDAVSIEKAHLHKEKPNTYIEEAKDHTRKYACQSLQDLKTDYNLHD